MKLALQLLLVTMMACGLTACGNKGKLKTPSQAAAHEAKKAEKLAKQTKETPAQKKAAKAAEEAEEEATSPVTFEPARTE